MDKSFSCSMENIAAKERWDSIHSSYALADIACDDWLEQFGDIINSCNTPIIDLGCGSGNTYYRQISVPSGGITFCFIPKEFTADFRSVFFTQLRRKSFQECNIILETHFVFLNEE